MPTTRGKSIGTTRYGKDVQRRPPIWKFLGLALLLAAVLAGCSTPAQSVPTTASNVPKVIFNVATYYAIDTAGRSPHGIVTGRAWPCEGVEIAGGDATVLVFFHSHLAAQET